MLALVEASLNRASQKKHQPYGIHWFRRDLRAINHAALQAHAAELDGRILGVFFFDSTFLARSDFSHGRFAFFLKTLQSLQERLREQRGDLLVLDSPPTLGFEQLFTDLKNQGLPLPQSLSFCRDYEPFARHRDAAVSDLLEEKFGIRVRTARDHLLIEPHELTRAGDPSEGSFYKIYTPFSRRWFELFQTPEIQSRLKLVGEQKFSMRWSDLIGESPQWTDQLEAFITGNESQVKIKIPKAGSDTAHRVLSAFRPLIGEYERNRDFPAVRGTSQMSIFFKNGSITSAEVIATLGLQKQQWKDPSSANKFLKEIVWREFYYHILYHCPEVETQAFNPKFRNLAWQNREDYFEAWKEGKTGYPIVDAGMRQLKQTGWMHNRVRMIVASFLTKDLLVDWRWGEKYFMKTLLDGDLAPNNGGWQWAASTGCDPQPYFRIFNPTLQSERFDQAGEYIRKFVPERSQLQGKAIHHPIDPIVDHAAQKSKALALFKGEGS